MRNRSTLTDRRFTRKRLAEGVADLLAVGPVVVSSRVLVEGTIRFADSLTVYDAAYLALAAARRIPICTFDTRLAKEARKVRIIVVVPGTDPRVA